MSVRALTREGRDSAYGNHGAKARRTTIRPKTQLRLRFDAKSTETERMLSALLIEIDIGLWWRLEGPVTERGSYSAANRLSQHSYSRGVICRVGTSALPCHVTK